MKSKRKAHVEQRFQPEEVGRTGFDILAERQAKGEIRWYAVEAGMHAGANRPWLWRVSYEVIALRPKIETQPELI
jgi:hypothetical protein